MLLLCEENRENRKLMLIIPAFEIFTFLIYYYYYNANFKVDVCHISSRGTFALDFGGSGVLFRLAKRT